jgi:hypothetical protein
MTANTPPAPFAEPVETVFSGRRLSALVLIYIVVTIVGTIVLHVTVVNTIFGGLRGFAQAQGGFTAALVDPLLTQAAVIFRDSGPVRSSAASGVSGALNSLITLVVVTALTHVFARYLLRGRGQWSYLVQTLLDLYVRWMPLQYILMVIWAAIIIQFFPYSLLMCFPVAGVSLYISTVVVVRVGKAYNFGYRKGCIAYILSLAIISFITGGIVYILLWALVTAFQINQAYA